MYNTSIGTMVGYYDQGAQEMEQQGLQTLYLMNPGYPAYEHSPTMPNILLLNSAAAAAPSVPPPFNPLLTHSAAAPPTSNNMQQFLGIPLLPAASTSDPTHDTCSFQAFTSNPNHLGLRQQQQQGLSLSLSPHHRLPTASSSAAGQPNGVSDMQRFWMGSRYLKVAQQLLDEVARVGNEVKGVSAKDQLRSTQDPELGKNEKSSELTTAERQDLQMKNVKLVNMLEEVEQRYKLYHHHIQTVVFTFEAAMGSGAARTYTAVALQAISKQFRWLKDAISAQIRGNAKCMGEEGGAGEDKSSSGWRLRLIDHQLRQKRAFQQIGMVHHNAWRPQRGLPERSVSILRAWLFQHFLHPYPKDTDKQLLAKQTGLSKSQVSNWFINARVRLWKPMVEEMYLEELKGGIGDENTSKSNSNGESTSQDQHITVGSPTIHIDRTNQQIPAFAPPHSALPSTGSDQEEYRRSNPKRVRSSESMHSNTMHHSTNMDLGVMERDEEGELLLKFGRGLLQNDEDTRHGYSLMSRKIGNGDAGFTAYPVGEVGGFSEEFSPRMVNKSSTVSLTLGLPRGENNNLIPLSMGHGQSPFPSSSTHESIQFGTRVELSSGSNNEYCGGGGLNKEPPCCSSLYI